MTTLQVFIYKLLKYIRIIILKGATLNLELKQYDYAKICFDKYIEYYKNLVTRKKQKKYVPNLLQVLKKVSIAYGRYNLPNEAISYLE